MAPRNDESLPGRHAGSQAAAPPSGTQTGGELPSWRSRVPTQQLSLGSHSAPVAQAPASAAHPRPGPAALQGERSRQTPLLYAQEHGRHAGSSATRFPRAALPTAYESHEWLGTKHGGGREGRQAGGSACGETQARDQSQRPPPLLRSRFLPWGGV